MPTLPLTTRSVGIELRICRRVVGRHRRQDVNAARKAWTRSTSLNALSVCPVWSRRCRHSEQRPARSARRDAGAPVHAAQPAVASGGRSPSVRTSAPRRRGRPSRARAVRAEMGWRGARDRGSWAVSEDVRSAPRPQWYDRIETQTRSCGRNAFRWHASAAASIRVAPKSGYLRLPPEDGMRCLYS
jgi:hypothetical protein